MVQLVARRSLAPQILGSNPSPGANLPLGGRGKWQPHESLELADAGSSPARPAKFVEGKHYVVEPIKGCWLWLKACWPSGYGMVRIGGKTRSAHIISYVEKYGPVPAGKELDHGCRVRRCINPDHVSPKTHKQNMQNRAEGYGTECKRHHLFDEVNTRIRKNGSKACRACEAVRKRYYRGSHSTG
jgi:HNH endonuclease